MSDPVFFVSALPGPGPFVLDGAEGRHAADVKRLRAGEPLVACDGAGTWAPATVTGSAGGQLTVDLGPAVTDEPSGPAVTLVQALPKGEHSDRAVDLATQAGVDAIVPWQSQRCVARWDGSPDKAQRGRERWQRVARAAAKQARRHWIPAVAPLARVDRVTDLVASADSALILHEAGSSPLAAAQIPTGGQVVLVVGPEGGLSPSEVDRLADAGGHAVRLGPEVLRTSSAAAIALGALGVLSGRWN